MGKRKVLLIVPSNKGTIAMCSANLYLALKMVSEIDLKCVLVYKFNDGIDVFNNCECLVNRSIHSNVTSRKFIHQVVELYKLKRHYKPHIAISTLNNASILNVISGIGEKKIGVFHAPFSQSKSRGVLFYLLTRLTYHFIFSQLDNIFCVSKGVYNTIINSFKLLPQERISVVYNIHDIDRIKVKSEESITDINEIKIFSNSVFLYCGRFDKNKAPNRLLSAFFSIKELLPNHHLVYIGDDTSNMWPSLKEMSENYGIGDRVHYLGRKDNPYKYMKKALATISSSYSEGLPGVLIESLILNTPIITTNSSLGVWEILSCDNMYQKELARLFIANKGIITTNSPVNNSDIIALGNAMVYMSNTNYEFRTCGFAFADNISAKSIVEKYLI